MSNEEFEIYTAQYAENTMKTINRKMGATKGLFRPKGQQPTSLFRPK